MKKSIILLMIAAFGITASAQTVSPTGILGECQRLYSDGDYATAQTLIKRIDTEKLDAKTRQEAELLKALITAENDAAKGRELLLQYINRYPETAKEGLLGCHIAQTYFYTGDYKDACRWFSDCDMGRLTPQQRDKATLHYALSLQECGMTGEATNMLRNLTVTSRKYANDAAFHLAVTDYGNDNLDAAYSTFKKLEADKKYSKEAPYYLAGIHLKQGDAESAKEIAKNFIAANKESSQSIRMQHILGAAEYALGNYEEAIEPLSIYIEKSAEPQRIAYYHLGASIYATDGDTDKALELLAHSNEGDDAVAQSSLLHTGIIQHKLGNASAARVAFEQAASMTSDDKIREEAMYNYALCLHQTRYSPFAESVKVFEKFLNEYPESAHRTKVEEYLVEVYLNSRNYDVALQSIEKLPNPSKEILAAKQKVLYRLGVQKFLEQEMEESIGYMDRSLELKYDNGTYADACYWKGEALYNMGKYSKASESYSKALATGGENSAMAMYGLAYSKFQLGKYNDARTEFERFMKEIPGNAKDLRADALNRIGDCHFYNKQYSKAESYYNNAFATDKSCGDYSLFRSALTMGLRKDYNGKVKNLKRVINEYPGSVYAEQAYYEMSRSYIELKKYNEAISTYDELLNKHPESQLARKAMAEKAMIYNIVGNSEKAIEAYKETIRRYPHSEEAKVAAQDLKNIYVERGEVEKFVAFAANTEGLGALNSSSVDTLTFIAAEKFYNKGEFESAIKHFNEYQEKFPNGAFKLNSHYYLGSSYYKSGMNDKAIKHLEAVIEFPDNKYSEVSIMYAAEIYQEKGNFDAAGDMYRKLLVKGSDNETRRLARCGLMRNAFKSGNHDEVISCASELLNDENTSPETRREALYDRAKSYMATGKDGEAMADFKELAKDTRTKEGAEAKYMVAQIMFNKKQYSDCEDVIMQYIEIGTPHSYWMARSFVLLSDLYAKQGKKLEAEQYLNSLRNNYSGDDDIDKMITERLKKLGK